MNAENTIDFQTELKEHGKRLAAGAWTAVACVGEGGAISLGGLNPWQHKWDYLGVQVVLPHPGHPSQSLTLDICRIVAENREISFATGELSANFWGFFLPAFEHPIAESAGPRRD